MRVATWNINGIRARQEYVLHWLAERKPDLVGLQELKTETDQFPFELFEEQGYHCSIHGQKAWNGVAILSRSPHRVLRLGLPGQEDQGARLIVAETEGLVFASVYCPNGKHTEHPDFRSKLAWFESLEAYLQTEISGYAMRVVGGDFNICPTALDTWDEEGHQGSIFHTGEERMRFQALLDTGLSDLFRWRFPDRKAFSWWDYRAGAFHQNLGLRIDLLLGSQTVAARMVDAVIDREYRKKKEGLTASDHAPVWVDIG